MLAAALASLSKTLCPPNNPNETTAILESAFTGIGARITSAKENHVLKELIIMAARPSTLPTSGKLWGKNEGLLTSVASIFLPTYSGVRPIKGMARRDPNFQIGNNQSRIDQLAAHLLQPQPRVIANRTFQGLHKSK